MQRKDLVQALLAKETGLNFVSMREAVALHDASIERFGGTPGARDVGLLESALHRPIMLAIYQDERDAFVLAAALAVAIVQNHPFLDGNKRAAYLASLKMLEKNGYVLDPDVAEAAEMFTGLAAHRYTEDDLLQWLKSNGPDRSSEPENSVHRLP